MKLWQDIQSAAAQPILQHTECNCTLQASKLWLHTDRPRKFARQLHRLRPAEVLAELKLDPMYEGICVYGAALGRRAGACMQATSLMAVHAQAAAPCNMPAMLQALTDECERRWPILPSEQLLASVSTALG